MNANVRELCGVSAATANWILVGFAAGKKLTKCRKGSYWVYVSCDKCLELMGNFRFLDGGKYENKR